MTGNGVDIEGRKPLKPDQDKPLADAKACLAAHDPFQPVLDLIDHTTSRLETAARSLGATTTSSLSDEQFKSLAYSTERAAERGVGIYATRIRSWHQAIVGGAFVVGAMIGTTATHYADARQSAAEINAMRLNVPAVLNTIPAADLAEWTTLIRSNPPPHALIAAGRMVPQASGQKAANMTLWLEPAPQQTPASH